MSGQDLNVQGDIQNELKFRIYINPNVQAKFECPGRHSESIKTRMSGKDLNVQADIQIR